MIYEEGRQTARDQKGAAIHEAGHAIVASALGLQVGRLEIAIDGDDAKGVAEIAGSAALGLVDQLAICAAGMEAQRLFSAPTHGGAGWADHGMMIALVEGLPEEDSRTLRYAGHQRAHDILIQRTNQVERLAERLFAEKRLEPNEVKDLLCDD
ncbi:MULTISPECIES: hypothetical protein [Bradyrhizobium]|jgi:hypothetical protein|uniref:Peptidase M41 domain-containing protein n=1 Tax=Bradyrhizobium denitrificans TaxID=2734912 RepID=A0ABS5GGJ3_9BRAD|nr:MULTISPECIES: hypothetical protein [Bradyrhizobium]MBR1140450.1 hypothetical protein [Bradyrhizobium denitrificans]MDU0958029.1 hypothetical protein [Bradyrhizobium sp.]MDU1496655.1 hypothetical protein [Bradyrhizobium sp.]MDU1546849.1 hypothetical protein [Bradyrhizobium sp.]MDU1688444.1 hypothetical protein [Bradyrhizobium sp.]